MAGYIGSKASVTVTSPETDSRYVNVTGDTMTGDLTVDGTTNATAYTKAGVAGKLLVKAEFEGNGANYSTTGFTNVALSDTVTFVPASANSEVWATITAAVQVYQTGGDNDAVGLIYAYTFQSDGTTRVSEIGTSDATLDREFGYVNSTANSAVKHFVSMQGECSRASDGNIYVRLWGSLETDGTGGYVATLTMQHFDIVFKEYL
mgnify:CR=1 FL=1